MAKIEYIPLTAIVIPQQYANSHPAKKKLATCAAWYQLHGILDRMLVIDQDNILIDGYVGYLTLLKAGVTHYIVERRVVGKRIAYIGGRHPNNPKMYYWEVTKRTDNVDALRPGNYALVHTKHGNTAVKIVLVAQAIEPPIDLPLSHVIRGFTEYIPTEDADPEPIIGKEGHGYEW